MQVMNLRVQQLDPRSSGDRARLVRFPFKLYKGDPYWVPPLIGDRKKFLDPASNPSFEYLKVAYFVAEAVVLPENRSSSRMGGGMEQDVGTIAAIVNPLHNEIWHDRVGFFGLFETVNSQEVAEALFGAAADWLRQQGCTAIRGPVTLTINDEVGVLVDGFDDSPRILMSYNLPYYPELIEACGFEGAMDLYAYHFDLVELYGGTEGGLPPKVLRVMEKLKQRSNLTLRKVDMAHFEDEVERIKGVYREAWAANWGEVPITDAEIKNIGKQLKPIIDPDFVHFIEAGDKTVGVALTIPDANFVLKRMGGRVFPFGWIQALRFQNKIPWLRVLILGVLPEYRVKGAEVMLFYQIVTEAIGKGIKDIEASWVLATNDEANRSTVNLGGKVYKTYRVYEREI
jgi:GNAT superfamily N-acetyltransferase